MVVVNRTTRGAYKLAELDGTISNYRYAAFRVVPYHARSRASVPVERILSDPEREEIGGHESEEELEAVGETDEEDSDDGQSRKSCRQHK